MGVPDVKFNKPGIIQSRQKFEVKKDGTATVTTRSSDGGTQTAATGNGVKSDAARRMYGAQTSTMFRSSTPALRTFNPNKVVIDHSGTRASLNSDQGWTLASMNNLRRENAALWKQMQGHQCSGGGNKFGDIAMAGVGTLGMLNKLLGADSTATPTARNNKKISSNSNESKTDNSTKSKLGDMQNAKDSAALSAAIDAAKAEKADIPKQNSQLQDSLAALKGKTDGLKEASDKAKMDLDENTQQINDATSEVNQWTTSVKSCQDTYNADEKAYMDADKAYQNAPDTITQNVNGVPTQVPNPQKPVLKAQAEAAKVKMEASRAKLETAEDNLNKAEGELKELKSKTDDLKQKAGDAKDAYDNNLKDLKETQTKIEDLTDKMEKLEAEIPKQEKRLTELQKKEDKELGSIDDDISKLTNDKNKLMKGINVNDANGLSDKEVKAKEKADKKQAEIDGLNNRKADLLSFKEMRNFSTEVVGGVQFKTGYSGGEKIYVANGKKVPEAEYKTLIEKARSGANA